MENLNYIILSILLVLIIASLSYVHKKRFGKQYSSSYHWFTRILR